MNRYYAIPVLLLCSSWAIEPAIAGEPALPAGLGRVKKPLEPLKPLKEPKLPAGLKLPDSQPEQLFKEPVLPSGLDKTDTGFEEKEEATFVGSSESLLQAWAEKKQLLGLSGFWESRGGVRTGGDAHEKNLSIAETRLQLEFEQHFKAITFNLTSDFIYDHVIDRQKINLSSGRGWIDLRSANLSFSPASFMDIKVGRQILTWGTGDLLFINDLFPKDWNAFFIGRDEEYLKAPSDVVKASLFSAWANLNIIYAPEFDADRFIDGRRLSYFSPNLGELAGRNAMMHTNRPRDGELFLRLYRNVDVYETAVYFYDGRWKSPGGFDPVNNVALFPKLRVIGGSIRGPLGKGIGNVEVGYYDSHQDSRGNNPLINNSEFRALAGYEQEIARNLTLGVQYYVEQLFDYERYRRALPVGFPVRDETRHLLTTRLTWLTYNQNLAWSVFTYFSPSDLDFYFRPKINYKIDDRWIAEFGGNFFGGKNDNTFFSQFHNNNNVYASIRYGF